MTGWVSDEVWARLDPASGALPLRTRHRVVAVTMLATVITFGLITMHVEGLLGPRLYADYLASFRSDPATHSFDEQLELQAVGWADVALRDVTVVTPGYRLTRVTGVPGTVPGDGNATIGLSFAVTDCAHPPAVEPRLRFHVDQWWGTTTVDVDLPRTFDNVPQFMSGSATVACGLAD